MQHSVPCRALLIAADFYSSSMLCIAKCLLVFTQRHERKTFHSLAKSQVICKTMILHGHDMPLEPVHISIVKINSVPGMFQGAYCTIKLSFCEHLLSRQKEIHGARTY